MTLKQKILKEFDEKFANCYIDKGDGGYFVGNYIKSFLSSSIDSVLDEVEYYKKEASVQLRKDNDFLRAIKKDIRNQLLDEVEKGLPKERKVETSRIRLGNLSSGKNYDGCIDVPTNCGYFDDGFNSALAQVKEGIRGLR